MTSVMADGNQQSNQEKMINSDMDNHYAYPYVVGTIPKPFNVSTSCYIYM